jgi:anthranilate synthase/aminodeoxychorismate synthase-like glutamine amidotransferase
MILLIDNYDSFSHNLARYLEELGSEVRVVRNDALSVEDALATRPDAVVVSPGPGRPAQAGISTGVIQRAPAALPNLGVCLGQQCISVAHGGGVGPAPLPVHGKLTEVVHDGVDLFANIPSPFLATRYHSLVVPVDGLPSRLQPLAWTREGTVMALRDRRRPVWGVQYHPEALLTEHGHALLVNFLALAAGKPAPGTTADLPPGEYSGR